MGIFVFLSWSSSDKVAIGQFSEKCMNLPKASVIGRQDVTQDQFLSGVELV